MALDTGIKISDTPTRSGHPSSGGSSGRTRRDREKQTAHNRLDPSGFLLIPFRSY
jgi:hypothetical protein